MLDIHSIMRGLADKRPIFHSEADFQFALAWHIKKKAPNCEVRLEWPPLKENMRIDIWLRNDATVIELKYPLDKAPEIWHDGERFKLGNYRSAQARYSFVKDIERIEQLVDNKHARVKRGFAVLLTNRPRLWKEPPRTRPDTNDKEFRIHEHRRLKGELCWRDRAPSRRMQDSIKLQKSYKMSWRDYHDFGAKVRFRYLAIEVGN